MTLLIIVCKKFILLLLTGDYEEILDTPAYEDDDRFERINFPWLINTKPEDNGAEENTYYQESTVEDKVKQQLEQLQKGEKMLLQKGVLNTKDLACLKSVKAFGDTVRTLDSVITLYWFAEFMVRKDLQADYTFLKSCLVKDITCELPKKIDCVTNSSLHLYKLDILIKK